MSEQHDDTIRSGEGTGATFGEVLEERLSRREMLRKGIGVSLFALGGTALGRAAGLGSSVSSNVIEAPQGAVAVETKGLRFQPIQPQTGGDRTVVAQGYRCKPLLKWGDPLFDGAPAFDPAEQSAEKQERQFGYNCDFVGFMPLPFGSQNSSQGLLVVNHEYTDNELMFPNYDPKKPTRAQMDVVVMAHGLTVVEISKGAEGWSYDKASRFNRRITGLTPMKLSGPAASSDLMKTNANPAGDTVLGTLNNCAAGKTPWGTVLTSEENFHGYFGNLHKMPKDDPRRKIHERYGIAEKAGWNRWEAHFERCDMGTEPNEPFRFGWVVEVDPYDPESTPVKRTALGRFCREACTSVITPSGRVALYSGDDARFEYVYKFVTARPYNAADRKANFGLLDEGTLYVARFDADGTGDWLPLVFGHGPLTAENGFHSQADVLINTRYAADLLGATKMDRPEDIETSPKTGKVYIVCTNNSQRATEGKPQTDPANPRPENKHGHIIELVEAGDDHAATRFEWEMFLVCGDPEDDETFFAGFDKSRVTPISCPDNITFDLDGNLWIATDGMPKAMAMHDGFFAVPTEGPERGHLRQFFSAPPGAEVCGPEFTPDNTTVFLAIQHPGEGGTFEEPISRWPDGDVAKPSVVVIEGNGGGRIGQ
jgi:uncharacterized protein